ncbi:flippase [Ureibacillus sp. FSL K6-0165]|uniref:flippase n=1 Tax=Ureibacillus sp. FSL K6-0165 TaxID=2954606 RepID=UPI0030F5B753
MTDKRRLIENFSALTIMQLLNYILPFVTLPYLARVLSLEGYGVYIFSQALIAYFIVIVDFGFDLSGTREVSINRHNSKKLSEIFSSILVIKFILMIISLLILIALIMFVPSISEYWHVHLIMFIMVFGNMLLSTFVYQGLEKMKFITILNASIKIFFTLTIFIFIKDQNDLPLVALLNSIGYLIVGLISLCIILKIINIKFTIPSKENLINQFKNSLQFFWSRIAVSLYTTSNTFVVGLFLGPAAAGIFGSADKLFRAAVSLYQPLNNVLYPYIAHSKNIHLYKKLFKLSTISNMIVVLIVYIFSDLVIRLIFGSGYEESAVLLKIFMIAAIYMMPSILMGYPLLGALGYTREVNKSVIYASIIHVVLLVILIPVLSVKLVALLVLFTELLVFIYRYYYVKKYGLLNSNFMNKQ